MSALVIKEIKPTRLKNDALRLTLLNETRKVGTQIKADFEKTTATWEHKVKFEKQISLASLSRRMSEHASNQRNQADKAKS